MCFIDVVNNLGTADIVSRSPLTIGDLCQWRGDGKFEGGVGFKNVNIPISIANFECRLSISGNCEWMIAKELKIVKV